MRFPFDIPLAATALVIAMGAVAVAATSQTEIHKGADQLCIRSSGMPDHAMGTFPNAGNPHWMRAQNTHVCVTATPEKGAKARAIPVTGIAHNSVLIRPGTADDYDARGPRGHSRDRSSG